MVINSGNLFLTVLEAGSPRSGCQQAQVRGKALFWVADGCLLVVSLRGGSGEASLQGLFYKGTNPVHEGSGLLS